MQAPVALISPVSSLVPDGIAVLPKGTPFCRSGGFQEVPEAAGIGTGDGFVEGWCRGIRRNKDGGQLGMRAEFQGKRPGLMPLGCGCGGHFLRCGLIPACFFDAGLVPRGPEGQLFRGAGWS